MTYKEFENKVSQIAPVEDLVEFSDGWRRYNRYEQIIKGKVKKGLYVEWSTGGVSGGNCWNEGGHRSYSSNEEPEELTALDEILNHFCPQITFLQFRLLSNKLVKFSSRTESEYYGNSTNYSSKYILLEELYEYMNKNNFLEDV